MIIVGTHADKPFEDPQQMESNIKKSLSGKTYEQHVRRPFYRVDNTHAGEDEGVAKLRQEIREVKSGFVIYYFSFIGLTMLQKFFSKLLHSLIRILLQSYSGSRFVAKLRKYENL